MPAPTKRNWVFSDSNTGKKVTKQFENEDQALAHANANSNLTLVRRATQKNYNTLTQVGNVTKINKATE